MVQSGPPKQTDDGRLLRNQCSGGLAPFQSRTGPVPSLRRHIATLKRHRPKKPSRFNEIPGLDTFRKFR